MIIYHDLRPCPLFKPYFEACGISHANHFRNKYIMLLCGILAKIRPLIKSVPLKYIYTDPVCDPNDDKIIVFDTHSTSRYLDWLRRRHPDKRVILWFWNPGENIHQFIRMRDRVECWSYCERDARKYGIRYNTQFYFDCLAKEADECPPPPADQPPRALFVGREKGREPQLKELSQRLTEIGVVPDFRLIYPPKAKVFPSLRETLIPYREVVDAVKASQILIDLYTDTEAGLSLRAMEALFFGKKLITNRPLMREEDFYDSRNIYILGEETRSLKEFLDEPYTAPAPSIRERYLLSNWLKRFDEQSASGPAALL